MTAWGRRKAVLSVNVPGRAPYAVLESRFKWPRGKADYEGAGLPALVSTTDPNDVEILWEEVASLEDQIQQRVSDAFRGQKARLGQATEMQRRMIDAAMGSGAGQAVPGASQDAAREAMAQNAKQALAYVTDPAMRRLLIEQYRAAGIPVDEED